MRRNRRNNAKKERIIMIASSAFVLTALTMTGIYMKSGQEEERDNGYTIDFSALENNVNDKMDEIQEGSRELARDDGNSGNSPDSVFGGRGEKDLSGTTNLDNDLDYLPMEAGSGQIEIPGLTGRFREETPSGPEGGVTGDRIVNEGISSQGDSVGTGVNSQKENTDIINDNPAADEIMPEDTPVADHSPIVGEEASGSETDTPAAPEDEQIQNADGGETAGKALHFAESDGLLRPVSGEVLIPYSMDGTVYFSTLDQFKYNSALVLAAELGSPVLACADARVVDIFENEEIGQAVTMELGDGYQITYGQLEALNVAMGSHVEAGEVIGWIAQPTKYYCVEGSNLYLRLTADGLPVNPETLFR